MKFPPEEGDFIIFLEPILNENEIIVFKLFREEPFAIEPWNEEKEKKIINFLQRGDS